MTWWAALLSWLPELWDKIKLVAAAWLGAEAARRDERIRDLEAERTVSNNLKPIAADVAALPPGAALDELRGKANPASGRDPVQ